MTMRKRNVPKTSEPTEPKVLANPPVNVFDIVALFITKSKSAPASGKSHYIVLEAGVTQTKLFHPWTMTKFNLPTDEFFFSLQASDITPEVMVRSLTNLLERESSMSAKRDVPKKLIEELIAFYKK